MELTTSQKRTQDRKSAVWKAYKTKPFDLQVTALVKGLSKYYKVSEVTIYKDIKDGKAKDEAINFVFTDKTTPDEWFEVCNRYAKSIGYSTSGNFDDYLDQYDDGETPYDTIREDLLANQ